MLHPVAQDRVQTPERVPKLLSLRPADPQIAGNPVDRLPVDDSQNQGLALIAEDRILLPEFAVAESEVLFPDLVLEDPLGRRDVNIAAIEVSDHRLDRGTRPAAIPTSIWARSTSPIP